MSCFNVPFSCWFRVIIVKDVINKCRLIPWFVMRVMSCCGSWPLKQVGRSSGSDGSLPESQPHPPPMIGKVDEQGFSAEIEGIQPSFKVGSIFSFAIFNSHRKKKKTFAHLKDKQVHRRAIDEQKKKKLTVGFIRGTTFGSSDLHQVSLGTRWRCEDRNFVLLLNPIPAKAVHRLWEFARFCTLKSEMIAINWDTLSRVCISDSLMSCASPCSVSGRVSCPGVTGAWAKCFKRPSFVQRQQSKSLAYVWVGTVERACLDSGCHRVLYSRQECSVSTPKRGVAVSVSTATIKHDTVTGKMFAESQFLLNLHALPLEQKCLMSCKRKSWDRRWEWQLTQNMKVEARRFSVCSRLFCGRCLSRG